MRSATSFATPKSRILTRRSPSARTLRKRFAGLRSRWTIPARCVSSSASAVWCRHASVSSGENRPTRRRHRPSSSPRSSSMTRNGTPVASSTPASKTSTMNGLSTCAVTRASSSNRLRSSGRSMMWESITLSADRRPVPR
ncbi:hypothetical protein BE11_12085 [Sorangium cellulosum]|nr:hypothetical protein BE11_12085 [Sorangium cellulosum]